MSIVFSAITPHPPVLIPEIGKDNLDKLTKTTAAITALESDFYAANPDSLIVISSQDKAFHEAFTVNLSADYQADFKDFGDFSVELNFKSDYLSMQEIRAGNESGDQIPVVMHSEAKLDHGFSVPLYFLTKHLKNIPIIPIAYCDLDYQAHYDFGKFLYRKLSHLNKRFAVVASADLSHKLSEDSPAGFDAKGMEFDSALIEALKSGNFKDILKIDPELAHAAGENGLKAIIILLGLMDSFKAEAEVTSYEAPFGVGYAVCNFKF